MSELVPRGPMPRPAQAPDPNSKGRRVKPMEVLLASSIVAAATVLIGSMVVEATSEPTPAGTTVVTPTGEPSPTVTPQP